MKLRPLARPSRHRSVGDKDTNTQPRRAPAPVRGHRWSAPYYVAVFCVSFMPCLFECSYGIVTQLFRAVVALLSAFAWCDIILPLVESTGNAGLLCGAPPPPTTRAGHDAASRPNCSPACGVERLWAQPLVVSAVLEHQLQTVLIIARAPSVGQHQKLGTVGDDAQSIPEATKNCAEKLIGIEQCFDFYKDLSTATWQARGRTGNVDVWATSTAQNWGIAVGRVLVEANPSQRVSLWADDARRAEYDEMFSHATDHRPARGARGVAGQVRTLVYSGMWPVSERYFHVITAWQPHRWSGGEDLGALISSQSVNPRAVSNPLSLPTSFVNARLYVGGFAIRPVAPPPAQMCEVTMVSHVDFGGSLPARLINHVQSTVVPAMLEKVR